MNTIHRKIQNALREYEETADRFERGEATRRELIHAQRKLFTLRAERDLEVFAGAKIHQPVTA